MERRPRSERQALAARVRRWILRLKRSRWLVLRKWVAVPSREQLFHMGVGESLAEVPAQGRHRFRLEMKVGTDNLQTAAQNGITAASLPDGVEVSRVAKCRNSFSPPPAADTPKEQSCATLPSRRDSVVSISVEIWYQARLSLRVPATPDTQRRRDLQSHSRR